MPTFKADIREIEQVVYGRDMRMPLADAIKKIKDFIGEAGIVVKRIQSVEAVKDESSVDRYDYTYTKVYLNYIAGSSNMTDLTVTPYEYPLPDYLTFDISIESGETAAINDMETGYAEEALIIPGYNNIYHCDEDYMLTDSKSSDDVKFIEDEDYRLDISNASWSSTESELESYSMIYYVPIYDDYFMVIDYLRKGG